MKQVTQYFKDFPGKSKCFTTSDGLVFHENGDANLHATSLDDKEVLEHDAAKYRSPKSDDNSTDAALVQLEADKAANKPYNKRSNPVLIADLKAREIEVPENGTKAEFVALLEENDKVKA